MKSFITTNSGIIEFEPIHFENGNKIIEREKSKENLLLFRKIMRNNNISFGLIYGTLLGAIREQNFIAHDEDTDVYILNENRENFLNVLNDLINIGFKIGRYNGDLLSIIRDGEYIDIYIFKGTSKNTF